MASTHKEPGFSATRVAAAIRRIRRGNEVTTVELSRRLTALGQPIPDTSITKTEQGTRRVDVDDLVALALALGVTPNTLLMPEVRWFGAEEIHELTPEVRGTAAELWQWAQGEQAIHVLVDGAREWLGDSDFPALEFPVRSRPYLTAPLPPGAGDGEAGAALRALTAAVGSAKHAGASDADIRRAVELTMSLPVLRVVPEFRNRIWGGPEEKEKP